MSRQKRYNIRKEEPFATIPDTKDVPHIRQLRKMLGFSKRAPNETAKFRNAVKNYIDTFVLEDGTPGASLTKWMAEDQRRSLQAIASCFILEHGQIFWPDRPTGSNTRKPKVFKHYNRIRDTLAQLFFRENTLSRQMMSRKRRLGDLADQSSSSDMQHPSCSNSYADTDSSDELSSPWFCRRTVAPSSDTNAYSGNDSENDVQTYKRRRKLFRSHDDHHQEAVKAENVVRDEKPHEYMCTSGILGPDVPRLTTESEADDELVDIVATAQDWEVSVRVKEDTRSPTVDIMRYPEYPGDPVAGSIGEDGSQLRL
ncbi:hypothetical protein ACHAO9_000404 [Fusarium lateritium]